MAVVIRDREDTSRWYRPCGLCRIRSDRQKGYQGSPVEAVRAAASRAGSVTVGEKMDPDSMAMAGVEATGPGSTVAAILEEAGKAEAALEAAVTDVVGEPGEVAVAAAAGCRRW